MTKASKNFNADDASGVIKNEIMVVKFAACDQQIVRQAEQRQ